MLPSQRHAKQFPFFKKLFPDPFPEDEDPFPNHPFLRLKVTRRNSTEGADEENDVPEEERSGLAKLSTGLLLGRRTMGCS